jgi:hypothetical protein
LLLLSFIREPPADLGRMPGIERWVARRVASVHTALHLLRGLLPEDFGGCAPTLTAFGERLGVAEVLVALRGIAESFLPN